MHGKWKEIFMNVPRAMEGNIVVGTNKKIKIFVVRTYINLVVCPVKN